MKPTVAPNAERTHEVRAHNEVLPSKLILAVVAGLVIVTVAFCFGAYGVLRMQRHDAGPTADLPNGPPHEVANVRQEAFAIPFAKAPAARTQALALSRYRWVDKDAHVVAIPIERAMELVVKQMDAAAPPREAKQP